MNTPAPTANHEQPCLFAARSGFVYTQVLAEAAFHLQSVSTVLGMVRDGLVEVAFHCRENWPHLEGLATRYADRNPDLADLCLVRLSELHPRHSVVTIDRADFKIYRRNKRETIPILCPPEK